MKKDLSRIIFSLILMAGSAFWPRYAHAAELSNQFTVELWVKPVSSVATKALLVKNNELRLYTDGSGNPSCQIYSGGAWQAAATKSSPLPLNSWSHIACTYNKSQLIVYVNGVADTAVSLSSQLNDAATNFRVGSDEGGTYGDFNGWVDDIRIYNYARTQKQIIEDMNAGHPAVGSPVGSPIAYYKFDEGYGTTVNNSGNGGMSLNGTLGTGSSAPSWTNDGKFGKALSFDGVNDYVTTGTGFANFQDNTPFSVSVWIRTKSSSSQSIVAKWKATVYGGWRMDMISGKIRFFLSNSGGNSGRWIQTDSTYNNGLWQHVVGVYDGSGSANGLKIYINGIVVPTTILVNTSPGTLSDTPIYIGATDSTSLTYFFNGLIDEVKIYNYALSEDEIKEEYNRGAAMVLGSLSDTSGLTGGSIASSSASAEYCVPGDTSYCAPPVGRWDFNEKTGQYAYDTSGNGNNGTLGASSSPGSDDPTWTSGKIGGGLKFDGSDDYVNLPTIPQINAPYTVELWFKPTKLGSYQGLLSLEPSGNYPNFNFWANNKMLAYCGPEKYRYGATALTSKDLNKWWHVAFIVADGSSLTNWKVYLNGKDDTGISGANTGTYYEPGTGGRVSMASSNRYFQGSIDHIRIYNYARSPAQIAWDYNRGKPVVYYKLDECSGSTIHSTNEQYNSSLDATLTIGASGTQTSAGTCTSGNSSHAWYNGATGKFNSSLNFDGTDDYAASGNVALIAAASQTYSDVSWGAWVKASSNQTNKTILHKSSEFRLYTDSNGYPTCQVGDTGNTAAASSALPNNSWSHLLCTYDGSNIKLYINGTLVASNSRTGTITSSSSTNINIAQKSDSSQRYAGQIDEVVIYNYALTPVLARQLYNRGAGINFGPESGMP